MEITNNFNFYDQSRFVKIENMDVENFSEYMNSYQRHSSVSDSVNEADFEQEEVDEADEAPPVAGYVGASHATELPEELKSKKAKAILDGLVSIKVLDKNYQPNNLTGYQKGYLAHRIAEELRITNMWVLFGRFWNVKPKLLRNKYNDALKLVTIGARKGSFDGMLQKRRFNIILVDQKKQQGVNLAKSPKGKVVKYAGQAMTVKLK